MSEQIAAGSITQREITDRFLLVTYKYKTRTYQPEDEKMRQTLQLQNLSRLVSKFLFIAAGLKP